MANNKLLRYGSRGSDVKTLQEQLNQNGFNLAVDGSFGQKTLDAVRQFQKKNNLSVDGIVGNLTNGALRKGTIQRVQGEPSEEFDFNKIYSEAGTNLSKVNDALTTHGNKFTYDNQTALDDALADYSAWSKKDFNYDVNADALYQQYKDKYIQQGRMAMADTIGQASAMTGGYGNSYAATVGNQAYQSYLQQLNDVVPELYQMAYDRHLQEGQNYLNQYSLLSSDRSADYGLWSDERNRLLADRDYYTGRYDSGLAFAYQDQRNKIADKQWQDQFDFAREQYNDSKFLSGGGGYKASLDDNGNPVVTPAVGENNQPVVADNKQAIIDNVKKYSTPKGQEDYLAALVNNGEISKEESAKILKEHGITPLTEVDWEMTDDGGKNWLWGIDNDAYVRNPETNKEYSLKELKKELQKTMSNKEAKNYIKELQDRLGI